MRKSPTPAETVALQLLWDRGTATVPELYADICQNGKVGYTTVLKRIQRMEEKGLIKRIAAEGRAIAYQPLARPEKARCSLVTRLIDSAFDGSPNALIQHAIGEHKLTSKDIDEIRALLDQVEGAPSKKSADK